MPVVEEILGRIAGQFLAPLTHEVHGPLLVVTAAIDHPRQIAEQGLQRSLAPAQRLQRVLMLGKIADVDDNVGLTVYRLKVGADFCGEETAVSSLAHGPHENPTLSDVLGNNLGNQRDVLIGQELVDRHSPELRCAVAVHLFGSGIAFQNDALRCLNEDGIGRGLKERSIKIIVSGWRCLGLR